MTVRAAAAARVLVAEDEAHLGILLEQFLASRGHRVTLVRDGRAALAALEGSDYEVAITDVQMPGLDGLALLVAARALPLPPEVVVVTGNGAADVQLRALRAGAYDAVPKPYRMAELELKVQRAAEKRRLGLRRLHALFGEPPLLPVFVAEDPAAAAAEARARELVTARGGPLLLVGEPGSGRRTLAAALAPSLGAEAPFLPVPAAALAASADPAGHARTLARLATEGLLLVRHADRLAPEVLEAVAAAVDEAGGALAVAATPGAPAAAWARARPVALPPLRRRPADVIALAGAFAARLAGRPAALSPEAGALLLARRWPGNAAELAAVVAAAVPRWTDRDAPIPATAFAPAD